MRDTQLLPPSNLDKLLARRQERETAKKQAQDLLQSLSAEKRQAIVSPKKKAGKAAMDQDAEEPAAPAPEATKTVPEAPKPATPTPREKSERVKMRETRKAERLAKEEKQEKDKQVRTWSHPGTSAPFQLLLPAACT